MTSYDEIKAARKLRRNTDPVSSHLAAEKYAPKLSERRQQVLTLVKMSPGLTCDEYSRLMVIQYPELPLRIAISTPQKRLSELESLGLVRKGLLRECKDSGNLVLTWYPVLQQVEMF
jgi:hypothetical protein